MKNGYFFGDKIIHLFNVNDRRMCDGKRIDESFILSEVEVQCEECKNASKGLGSPVWMIDELIASSEALLESIRELKANASRGLEG